MERLSSSSVFGIIGRRPDLLLAAAVSAIVAMLIVPLPNVLLDILIGANLGAATLLLMAVLFSKRPLDLPSFPALLLLSTMFRLGLNVSTTRGILSKGSAGQMVHAFGDLVVGGDLIVGIVIFLVLTLVQLLVVGKGAERVAEVAARFALDAMPGEQMSIDAALRSGFYSETEAAEKREGLARKSQLFGNMDGAMKFVKGDAIFGVIITALNLTAGVAIGVLRHGMNWGGALATYSVLSIGDAVASQIPSVMVTLAAGMLVTRVSEPATETKTGLGYSVKRELVSNPTVLSSGAALMFLLALVPGLPALPFLLTSAAFVAIWAGAQLSAVSEVSTFAEQLSAKLEAPTLNPDQLAPSVPPLGIDLDPTLSEALGIREGVDDGDVELLAVLMPQLREALYLETGIRFPPLFVRAGVAGLAQGEFVVRINDVPVLRETVSPTACLALVSPAEIRRYGIEARPTRNPLNGGTAAMVPVHDRAVLEASGLPTWSAAGAIALYIASILRSRTSQFLGLGEVSDIVTRMETACPALVRETVPKLVSVSQLAAVLRILAEEGVSIRDMKTILEALATSGSSDPHPVGLAEHVRQALATQLAFAHAGLEKSVPVVLLDSAIEDTLASSDDLGVEPEIARSIVEAIRTAIRPVVAAGIRPALVTSSSIRRRVWELIRHDLRPVSVLSFEELPADAILQPLGRATLSG
ncbi:MAG: FHIPEP family type III secretion protein [Deltaproteobacteria bacterium]|nr:FHIPEP family type III secretion protein [Deltaproteobacteria bacterium]